MRHALLLAASLALLTPSVAQESAAAANLHIELNALQSADTGCRVTFLATNELAVELTRAAVETAFFNADGAIERIVTLDFKALTPGKTKVLQFALNNLDCTKIGRILINDITSCEGTGLTPQSCLAQLTVSARPDITFGV